MAAILLSFAMAEKQNNMLNKNYGVNQDDASLVSEFISKDLHQRHLRNESSLSEVAKGIAYIRLANLLRLLKNEKVLDILDKKWNSEGIYIVNDLRQLSFEGSWLDSIEKLFANNLHNDVNSLAKLEDYENQLCNEHMFLNGKVIYWSCQLKYSEAEFVGITNRLPMDEENRRMLEIKNIRQTMETFIQQREAKQREIEQVFMKKMDALKGRAQLDALEVDFSCPTLFRNKI